MFRGKVWSKWFGSLVDVPIKYSTGRKKTILKDFLRPKFRTETVRD